MVIEIPDIHEPYTVKQDQVLCDLRVIQDHGDKFVKTPLERVEDYLGLVLEFRKVYTFEQVIKKLTDVGINFFDAYAYLRIILESGYTLSWVTEECESTPPGYVIRWPDSWDSPPDLNGKTMTDLDLIAILEHHSYNEGIELGKYQAKENKTYDIDKIANGSAAKNTERETQ